MVRVAAWLFRVGVRGLMTAGAVAVLYGLGAVAGAVPLAVPQAPTGDADRLGGPAVRIYVVSNGVHTDLVLPVYAAGFDWSLDLKPEPFGGRDPARVAYVGFGWGDRDFYLSVPTWAELSPKVALRSLFLSQASVVHVTLWAAAPVPGSAVKAVDLTAAQYAALFQAVGRAFRRSSDGQVMPIRAGYGRTDSFFEGLGRYTPFDTCNQWTAARLRQIGVAVGWWSPFPFGVMWNL